MNKFGKTDPHLAHCNFSSDGQHELGVTSSATDKHFHSAGGEDNFHEITNQTVQELMCRKCLSIFNLNILRYQASVNRIKKAKK